MGFMLRAALAFLAVTCLPAVAGAEDVPTITNPVMDLAGLIDEDDEKSLAERLRTIHDETGVQMAVLVIETTNKRPIEDYSLATAERWGGGSKERDDGLLLTIAVRDRQMRLEVGYGLEALIPDAVAKRIIDAGKPQLRLKDYAGAVAVMIDGVEARLGDVEPGKAIEVPLALRATDAFYTHIVAVLTLLPMMLMLIVGVVLRQFPKRSWPGRVLIAIALCLLACVLNGYLASPHYDVTKAILIAIVTTFAGGCLGATAFRKPHQVWALLAAFTVILTPIFIWASYKTTLSDPGSLMGLFIPVLVVWGGIAMHFYARAPGRRKVDWSWSSSGSSSSYSSSSYSSSSSSSYSSSSSSSYSGGGGSFGGGGASSSW